MAAGATYTPIATTTLGSAATTISLSSIPSTYTDLILTFVGTGAVVSFQPAIQFNGDTATNYSSTALYGDGTSVGTIPETNINKIVIPEGNTLSTTVPSSAIINIMSYAGSTYKTSLIEYSGNLNSASGTVNRAVGMWRSTAAINQILIRSANGAQTMAAGTTITLYGILKA